MPGPSAAAPATGFAAASSAPAPEKSAPLKDIISPMVGTFYRAGSPESPAFVDVGKQVSEESVVCIIEAMKVMNEIKAETSGRHRRGRGRDGNPVQFGQVLFGRSASLQLAYFIRQVQTCATICSRKSSSQTGDERAARHSCLQRIGHSHARGLLEADVDSLHVQLAVKHRIGAASQFGKF